ncbi:MAB_1171c family putative transporter [Nocardia sp. NPDC127579]|uniref:MAB_1171c family putative transporter n=1 Tax=Nocardia sp. NPDC127579 TaxID=3345402 RepID=UPI003626F1A7
MCPESVRCWKVRSLSSLVPGVLAWPLILCIAGLVVGRFLFFRAAAVDVVVNRLFGWGLAALLLFRFPAPAAALCCVVVATTQLHALGYARHDDLTTATVRRRRRSSGLVAALSVLALGVAGATVYGTGRPFELDRSWTGLVIAVAVGIPTVMNTGAFVRGVVREYRGGNLVDAERVVVAAMVLSTVFVWVTGVLSVAQLALGWPRLGPHLPRMELAFLAGMVVNAVPPLFPLVMALLDAVGLDREGRVCRRLDPLWRDLTSAVPEIVMHPASSAGTRSRMFRMTVEIRDALLHLAPYMPADRPHGDAIEDYATRVAHAVRARQAGSAPRGVPVVTGPHGAGDFETDLGQLLELSRVWRRASR